jgi:ATP-binding cassette subfamily B protein/ATP-binding cassette subfamily C protein
MAGTRARSGSNSLSEALRRCGFGFACVALFSFIINLLTLATPLYALQIFDRVLTSRSGSTLFYLTLIAAFALIILWALELVRGRLMITLGSWLDRAVTSDVLSAALRKGLEQQNPTLQELRDVGTIRQFLSGQGILPFLDAPWTPVFLAVVFLLHPLLGWIATGGALLLFVFALLNELAIHGPLKRAERSRYNALDEAQAASRNVDVVGAMGMTPDIVRRWTWKIDGSLIDQVAASRMSSLITASSKAVRQLLQILLLGVGAWLVLGNELSAGGMIASSILMGRALAPVEQAISALRNAVGAWNAHGRIKKLLTMMPQAQRKQPLPAPVGSLLLDRVSYAYPGNKEPFLRNIEFALTPGESLGLIGPTASGKSTLARIIVGVLDPQLGHARLDGVAMTEWHNRERRQYIGYLPQDVELFSGTVQDNIARLGKGDSDAVYHAAKIAGIHEDILALPNGYETEVGVNGVAISGGQRQRVGLARAMFGTPKLVVLDEPNSNLDDEGEKALLRALSHLREQRCTVVIIAHRPGVLMGVDKVLVLQRGEMGAFGARDTLLAQLLGAQTNSSLQRLNQTPNSLRKRHSA